MGDLNSKLLDAIERENLPDIIAIVEQAKKHNKPNILNQPFGSNTKMTPLLRIVWRGNLQITTWMLDNGADVNIKSELYLTQLMMEIQR